MSIKKLFLILSIITLQDFNSFGQSKFSLSGGIGYKTNTIDFPFLIFNYTLNKRIELTGGPSIHFIYLGQGFTAGARMYYPLEKKFFMDTEITFRYLLKTTASISPAEHESDVGDYFVPATNFVFIGEGLNLKINNDSKSDGIERISLTMYYGIPLNNYHYTFISGIESNDIEKEIERRITSGFGFSISVLASF